MRLIDADAFEVVTTKMPDGMNAESYMAGMDFVLNKIDDAPTIEPERKRGKWICSDDMYEYAICSCCKWDSGESWVNGVKWFKYCPNCGADMRGGETDV